MAALTVVGESVSALVVPVSQRASMCAARLLPALLLARIDGKSPVEYVTQDVDKDCVRRVARELLASPVDRLDGVRRAWTEELDQ